MSDKRNTTIEACTADETHAVNINVPCHITVSCLSWQCHQLLLLLLLLLRSRHLNWGHHGTLQRRRVVSCQRIKRLVSA